MNGENTIVHLIFLGLLFLLIFASGEYAYRFKQVHAENTRKWSHIASGLLALSFPVMLQEVWAVALLCSLFLGILVASKYGGFLPSINAVNRDTLGSYLFPVAVFIAFSVYTRYDNISYFYLPLLLLSISDMLAAIVGRSSPVVSVKIFGETKSLGGFLAFTASSLLICSLYHLFVSELTIRLILILPLMAASVELISPRGLDNITVPLIVMLGINFLL